MLPVLIAIGPVKISTLPIFMVLAFFVGLFVIWKRGRDLHYDDRELFDSTFVILAWMFVGSRLGYVILYLIQNGIANQNWQQLLLSPGLYYPGGLFFAAWACFRAAKKQRWDTYQLMDILVTGIIIAQAFMALGSFVAGVGYGLPTSSAIGVNFTGLYDKRYPIQLWEVFGYGLGFAYLWWVEGVYRTFPWYRGKKSQALTGFITSMYLIWWGFIAVVATLFRTQVLAIAGFRVDFLIPLMIGVLMGIWLLFYRATGSTQSMKMNVLEYFGLNRKPVKKKQFIDFS